MSQRILVAHKIGSNGELAKKATANLRTALEEKGYEVEYLTAPIRIAREDYPGLPLDVDTENGIYAWWKFDETSDLSQAITYVKSRNKNVVGFIGLSQGASLAALVGANYREWIPTLKFAIAYDGFYYANPDKPKLDAYPKVIDIPFLTVVGDKDDIIEPEISIKLATDRVDVEKSTILRHPGGHAFADDEKSVKKTIRWLEKNII